MNYTPQEIQKMSYQVWLSDGHRDNEILYKWDHIKPEVVVDLGGFEGKWSDELLARCPDINKMVIYEPIPKYFNQLLDKYRNDQRVRIYPFCAHGEPGTCTIYFSEAGSSANIQKPGYDETYEITKVDFGAHIKYHFDEEFHKMVLNSSLYNPVDILKSYKLPDFNIDLLKINIEGDEFAVINSLRAHDLLKHIKHILVQTHPYGKDPDSDYDSMFRNLSTTHERVWHYQWIWEYWRLK